MTVHRPWRCSSLNPTESRAHGPAATGSVFVGLVVLGLKLAAYYVTGSIALYSDALESIINVATAVAALIALRYSARPADANHRTRRVCSDASAINDNRTIVLPG